jgi:hypothetical protein
MSEANDRSESKYRKDSASKKGKPLNIASLAQRIERNRAKLKQLSTELKRLAAAVKSNGQLHTYGAVDSGKARHSTHPSGDQKKR